MWFLRIKEELSVGLNSHVENSSFVLSLHIPDCVTLVSEALVLLLKTGFCLYNFHVEAEIE